MTKKKFWVFFVITQIFLLINEPYAINRFLSVPNLSVTGIGYLIILCLYVLSNKGKIKALPTKINHIFVITIIAWLLYGIFFDDTSYFTRIVLLCITYLFSCSYTVLNALVNFGKITTDLFYFKLFYLQLVLFWLV